MKQGYPPKVSEQDQIILFDAVCKLCNGWSRFIIRFDKKHKFRLCSVQSAEGQAILAWFDLPLDHFTTMLLVRGDKAFTKSDSFIEIMKQLPRPFSLIVILKLIPKRLRDWLYDRIALNRYRLLGKYEVCMLPSADHRQRFLDSE